MEQKWWRLILIILYMFLFITNTKFSIQHILKEHVVVTDSLINRSNVCNVTWASMKDRWQDQTSLEVCSNQVDFQTNPNHLVMARVPKTGSTTLAFLMQKTFRQIGVKEIKDPSFRFISTRHHKELFVKRYFSRPNEKKVFLSHIRFIDFREFNRTPPIWISQVRDPTERFISRYHFVRRRERQNFKTLMRKRGVLEAEKWANMSVDECVGRGLHECNLRPRQEYEPSPITYFCGFESECSRHRSKWALMKAKENILRHFSMVGVLEDFKRSLELMEQKIPQLLKNISKEEVPKKNVTPRSGLANETTKKVLKATFALEYDLYEFVKATFFATEMNN